MMTSWHGNDFSLLAPCRGIHPSPVDSPHTGPVIRSLNVFCVISLNKLSNKHSSFETLYDVTWHALMLTALMPESCWMTCSMTATRSGIWRSLVMKSFLIVYVSSLLLSSSCNSVSISSTSAITSGFWRKKRSAGGENETENENEMWRLYASLVLSVANMSQARPWPALLLSCLWSAVHQRVSGTGSHKPTEWHMQSGTGSWSEWGVIAWPGGRQSNALPLEL